MKIAVCDSSGIYRDLIADILNLYFSSNFDYKFMSHEFIKFENSASLIYDFEEGRFFDIIFIDPPYAQKLYASVLSSLLDADMIKCTSLVVCESGDGDVFLGDRVLESRFEIVKNARYSHSYITILRPLEA